MQDVDIASLSADSINPDSLVLLGQGRTAEVYLFGSVYVVKLFRRGFPVQAIDNEYLVCRSIGELINIPRVRRRLTIAGRDAIIFDFVRGRSGFRFMLRSPWKIGRLAREFASLHAKIHSMTVPDEVPVLNAVLVRNINRHDLLPPDSKTFILNYLKRLPGGNSLCHGDFHPENILVGAGTPCVLDWMTAARGNPHADVARTSVLLKWAEPGPGTPFPVRALLRVIRRRFHGEYMREYLRLTGADPKKIEQWELPVLAARLMEWLPESEKKVLVSKIQNKLDVLRGEASLQ